MTALSCLCGSLPNLLPNAVVLLLAFSSCLLETSGFTGALCKGHVVTGIQSAGRQGAKIAENAGYQTNHLR